MKFDPLLCRFEKSELDERDQTAFFRASMRMRKDILELIAQAGSGHIGGSYSTLDALLMAYVCSDISSDNLKEMTRDRIVVSHGHVSAALYVMLADMGFLEKDELFREYRRVPGKYEGHPSIRAEGIDWGSGSLGQGLSVGCGMALANRIRGLDSKVFVFMGDGENEKGQIAEAMTLGEKYRLNSLIAYIDVNRLQCMGSTDEVLPMDLKARYEAGGWRVLEADGHDFRELYQAFRTAYRTKEERPCVIIGKTVMGKGIPFIENDKKYHGAFLDQEQLAEARKLFGEYSEEDLPEIEKSAGKKSISRVAKRIEVPTIFYTEAVACREAAGVALAKLGKFLDEERAPVVVDCDVAGSTGTWEYEKANPSHFVQCGIAEANAMSVTGGLAVSGLNAFFAAFGMFALGEPYGQLRTNIMNHAPVKVIATHCGLDVGADGKTHQCIDYISLTANLYGTELIIPADGNQTVQAVRYLAKSEEPGVLAVGRSKIPVIRRENGDLYYGADYKFRYGEADWIRRGNDAVVISYGTLLGVALNAVERLRREGILCGLLNISCPLRMDEEKLRAAAQSGVVIVFEDHNVMTGAGMLISGWMMEQGICARFSKMGLEGFGGSASAKDLYTLYGLDEEALVKQIKKMVKEKGNEPIRG